MAKSKITITGEAKKAPKVNEDGTVDLIFKIDMSEGVPKGLTSLGETNYMVHVGQKTWNKVASKVTENSFYIINGEPKGRVTTKGAPFIEVVCFDIALKETVENKEKPAEKPKEVIKEKPVKVEKPKQEKPKQEQPNKKKRSGPDIPADWFKNEEVIKLNVNDLMLVEKEHLKFKYIDMAGLLYRLKDQEINYVIAARSLENGKYGLVMGIKGYIIAKLLNRDTIKAVIKNCTYDEFVAEYEVKEENN